MSNATNKRANDVKHRLGQKQRLTLTEWGEKNGGYTMRQISDVIRGVNQGNYGIGREIAEKLQEQGLLTPETN